MKLRKPLSATLDVAGYLEQVSEDGWVIGWAWYPADSTQRVDIEILADGQVIGATGADMFRSDLRDSGIGDGAHGFRFALPDSIVARAQSTTITVRDRANGQPVGAPALFSRRNVLDSQARIEELEAKARLLESSLALLRAREQQERTATTELFSTVGNFFMQLAESAAAGRPPTAATTLQAAVTDICARFEPLELAFAPVPNVTIIVGTDAPLTAVYTTLQAIQQSTGVVRIEVLVLDDGTNPDTALLPLVVTNLRYVRAQGAAGVVAHWNRAARLARGKILVSLAAGMVPQGQWLRSIVSRFAADPSLAILGAHILPAGAGGTKPPAASQAQCVAANAFAVRLDQIATLGGWLETADGTTAAMTDLCARAKAQAASVVGIDPEFAVGSTMTSF